MDAHGHAVSEAFYRAMAAGDMDAVRGLYAADAQVVRFDGAANGVDEIVAFWEQTRQRHTPYELRSIDQFIETADVVMWDALVRTDRGILQTTEVLVTEAGLITRHIPGIRGWWGQ